MFSSPFTRSYGRSMWDYDDNEYFGYGYPPQYRAAYQREYLRRQQEERERQRLAALQEKRRRERMMEQAKREEQRQSILQRMDEKRLSKERSVPKEMDNNDEYVIVRGHDGNLYRVPTSVIQGYRNSRKEVGNTESAASRLSSEKKVQHNINKIDDSDEDYTESIASTSVSSYGSHSDDETELKNSGSISEQIQARLDVDRIVVEDASDSETEGDWPARKSRMPYFPGPGESWMEPVE